MRLSGRGLWGVLAALVLAGAAGVAFVSWQTLRLERDAEAARARADLEERLRSALWRMDLALARLAAQESARPQGRWLEPGGWGDVVGRFELSPNGQLAESGRTQALAGDLHWARLTQASGTLARLRADAVVASNDLMQQQRSDRGLADFNLRNRYAQQNLAPAGLVPAAADNAAPIAEAMVPAWAGDHLVLVRPGGSDSAPRLQGSVLDWAGLRRRLLADVADLLPEADLVPVQADDPDRSRMLATLPVRLVPGTIAQPANPGTPAIWILLLAWVALLGSAGGLVALVAGIAGLSERRAAFVSAVSHELRTPLTTFRMYAEMLEGGMVPEEKKPTYLRTLRVEAERLGRLVENVLAYARVEGGRAAPPTPLALGSALERIIPRLADRAAAAGMQLVTPTAEQLAGASVLAEPTALEQVLFNLVENACKYAAQATDRRLHLEVETQGERTVLRVRDHGPGVAPDVRGRLFTPFSKSAQQAAESAPGVGLGLALSRRLARAMGGELAWCPSETGACFALSLRRP